MSISLVIWWQQYESLLLRTLENVCTGQIMFIQNDIQTVEMCDRKMLMFHPKLDVKCDPTDFQKILKHKWKSTKEHSNRVESWYFIPILQHLEFLELNWNFLLTTVLSPFQVVWFHFTRFFWSIVLGVKMFMHFTLQIKNVQRLKKSDWFFSGIIRNKCHSLKTFFYKSWKQLFYFTFKLFSCFLASVVFCRSI